MLERSSQRPSPKGMGKRHRPHLDPRIKAAGVRKKAEEQKRQTDQMETEEPEGEPSTVEITMDVSKMDATFQVEPSDLPAAESLVETNCCNHLFSIEHDEVMWRFSTL